MCGIHVCGDAAARFPRLRRFTARVKEISPPFTSWCWHVCFCPSPGAVPVQQCNLSDVQLLPEQQELHSDQDHLRLHLAAGDHRCLHHAVAGCGCAAEKGTSGLWKLRKFIHEMDFSILIYALFLYETHWDVIVPVMYHLFSYYTVVNGSKHYMHWFNVAVHWVSRISWLEGVGQTSLWLHKTHCWAITQECVWAKYDNFPQLSSKMTFWSDINVNCNLLREVYIGEAVILADNGPLHLVLFKIRWEIYLLSGVFRWCVTCGHSWVLVWWIQSQKSHWQDTCN